jgi:hypothetical protein
LVAKYGVEDGRVKRSGQNYSLWWKDVVWCLRWDWFVNNIKQIVGDGENTLFWKDMWLVWVVLCLCFRETWVNFWIWSLSAISFLDLIPLKWKTGHHLSLPCHTLPHQLAFATYAFFNRLWHQGSKQKIFVFQGLF